jgi:hypothetical protein
VYARVPCNTTVCCFYMQTALSGPMHLTTANNACTGRFERTSQSAVRSLRSCLEISCRVCCSLFRVLSISRSWSGERFWKGKSFPDSMLWWLGRKGVSTGGRERGSEGVGVWVSGGSG